jgi:hypothetical protein
MKKENVTVQRLIGLMKRYPSLKGFENVKDDFKQFPTIPGLVDLYRFSFKDKWFSIVFHIEDEIGFVCKVYASANPLDYFNRKETGGFKKFFSTKAYRQNDPAVLKIVHHSPDAKKETWVESQVQVGKDHLVVAEAITIVQEFIFNVIE